jgi:hypothetical protein
MQKIGQGHEEQTSNDAGMQPTTPTRKELCRNIVCPKREVMLDPGCKGSPLVSLQFYSDVTENNQYIRKIRCDRWGREETWKVKAKGYDENLISKLGEST